MAGEMMYVVAIGAEAPRRVVVKKSLGDCLEMAQDVANTGLAATVTVFEVSAKEDKGGVCIPLVADGGLTPLALDMGAQQSPRQLRMSLEAGTTVTAINPAMR